MSAVSAFPSPTQRQYFTSLVVACTCLWILGISLFTQLENALW